MDDKLSSLTTYQKFFYNQVKSKIGIDAVYFLRDEEGVAKIPLIYFSMVEENDASEAAKLHCLSWNMGEAPLLFVVTPTAVKVFNNYQTPKKKDGSLDPEAGLIETISLLTSVETQRQKLHPYNRTLLESGEYWNRVKGRFDTSARIDTLEQKQRICIKISQRKSNDTFLPESRTIQPVVMVHSLLNPQ